MSITWEQESADMLVARVNGKLNKADIEEFQQAAAPAVKASGQMCFMTILENFEGWGASDNWADASFPEENDQYLKRFAIVGQEEWRDQALMFSLAGLRPVEIEYFTDEGAARAWLSE